MHNADECKHFLKCIPQRVDRKGIDSDWIAKQFIVDLLTAKSQCFNKCIKTSSFYHVVTCGDTAAVSV